MSRYGHHLVAMQKESGETNLIIVPGASISVYLASTSTPVKVWNAYSGGASNNATPQATCDGSGRGKFWVDTADGYGNTDLIDIIVESGSYSYTIDGVASVHS